MYIPVDINNTTIKGTEDGVAQIRSLPLLIIEMMSSKMPPLDYQFQQATATTHTDESADNHDINRIFIFGCTALINIQQ